MASSRVDRDVGVAARLVTRRVEDRGRWWLGMMGLVIWRRHAMKRERDVIGPRVRGFAGAVGARG